MVPDSFYWSENKVAPAARCTNATIFLLPRNSDLKGILKSMKQMEDRFNRRFQYSYMILKQKPFSVKVKEFVAILSRLIARA
jgi:alpha 1,2-mannosyltransferase